MTNIGGESACPDCDAKFVSGRALTQHRRFVHEGQRLFGYRLVHREAPGPDSEERAADPPSPTNRAESESEGAPELSEDGPDDSGGVTLLLLLAAAAVGFAAVYHCAFPDGPAPPSNPVLGGGPSQLSPYGPRSTGWVAEGYP
jgi:hypothetical protein